MLIYFITEITPVALAVTLFGLVVIPLSVWGVGVEKRFVRRKGETEMNGAEITNQAKEINGIKEEMKATNETIQKNQKEVMDGIHNIELQLTGKKDRE